MKKTDIPKGCYSYIELRAKLKINHRDLQAITRHHDCPSAGTYGPDKYHQYKLYNLADIKKFIKTGKRAVVNTQHGEFKEWEVPTHSPAERLISQRASQFYKLMAGFGIQ